MGRELTSLAAFAGIGKCELSCMRWVKGNYIIHANQVMDTRKSRFVTHFMLLEDTVCHGRPKPPHLGAEGQLPQEKAPELALDSRSLTVILLMHIRYGWERSGVCRTCDRCRIRASFTEPPSQPARCATLRCTEGLSMMEVIVAGL